jgi:hypothetical protein
MKKLFLILSVILSAVLSQAQCTSHLLSTAQVDGYGGSSGNAHDDYAIPYLQHIPPDAVKTRNGDVGFERKKYPVIVMFHGIEAVANFATAAGVTTSQLSELYGRPPMRNLRFASGAGSELVGKRFAAPGSTDSTQFIFLAPQTWSGAGYTFVVYPWNMLKVIRDSLGDIADTNRVYFTGLSFGGGATSVAIQDSLIRRQVAAAAIVCPGYRTYSGFVPTGPYITDPAIGSPTAFGQVARSGIPTWWFHSIDDTQTDGCGGLSSCSLKPVQEIVSYRPVTQPEFYHYLTGGGSDKHNVWDRVYDPNSYTASHQLVNGASTKMGGTGAITIYSWFLQYSTDGARRPGSTID